MPLIIVLYNVLLQLALFFISLLKKFWHLCCEF